MRSIATFPTLQCYIVDTLTRINMFKDRKSEDILHALREYLKEEFFKSVKSARIPQCPPKVLAGLKN
jgi:hypothetical protein